LLNAGGLGGERNPQPLFLPLLLLESDLFELDFSELDLFELDLLELEELLEGLPEYPRRSPSRVS
jgi:hypothetical protein